MYSTINRAILFASIINMFIKKITSWGGVRSGFRYLRNLLVVSRSFEVRQGALVPIDARDGTLVFACDCLKLVVDFGHHFHVDGVGVAVKLRTMTMHIFKKILNSKTTKFEMQLGQTINVCYTTPS